MVCGGLDIDQDYRDGAVRAPAFSLTSAEQLRNKHELLRLLRQHAAELDRLAGKLKLEARTWKESAKRTRQQRRVEHLSKHCVPFLWQRLESLAANNGGVDAELRTRLRTRGCLV